MGQWNRHWGLGASLVSILCCLLPLDVFSAHLPCPSAVTADTHHPQQGLDTAMGLCPRPENIHVSKDVQY